MMRKYMICAVLAILFFSVNTPAAKIAAGGINNFQILFISFGVAAMLLTLACIKTGRIKKAAQYSGREYLGMALLGLIGTFGNNFFLFAGVRRISAQNATIINYLWPVVAIATGVIFLHEKITVKKVGAVLLSMAGIVLVATQGNFAGFSFGSITGILCCLGAAFTYGLFCTLNKKFDFDELISMSVYFWVSTAAAGLCLVSAGDFEPMTMTGFSGLVFIGVFPMALGYLLFAKALAGGDTAKVSIMSYATPFIALVIEHFLLGENLSTASMAGLAVIISGILLEMRDKSDTASMQSASAEEVYEGRITRQRARRRIAV